VEWEVQERPNLLADGAEMLELDVVEVKYWNLSVLSRLWSPYVPRMTHNYEERRYYRPNSCLAECKIQVFNFDDGLEKTDNTFS
jgi:hypothetical protein